MTKRAEPGIRVKSPLTELENDVMQAVWDGGACTVEAVHLIVARKRHIKETSVRTLLRRLEQKGYLRHEEEGRAYVYRATGRASDSRSLAAHAVRQIIDRFCRGSVEELVSGMVDARVLSKVEMDRLEEFVRSRKQDAEAESKESVDRYVGCRSSEQVTDRELAERDWWTGGYNDASVSELRGIRRISFGGDIRADDGGTASL